MIGTYPLTVYINNRKRQIRDRQEFVKYYPLIFTEVTGQPVASEVVASWPQGHFAENLAVDSTGVVYVSLHSHNRIDRFNPKTGKVDEFAQLTAPAAGLAFDAAGALWVTGGAAGQAPGYIWRIVSGQAELWVEISDALFMNGSTPHPDGRTLLVCESVTGRILAIDQKEKRWRGLASG